MKAHPSELQLERHLLDPEASPVRDHVGGCERCAGRIAEMERDGERFRRFVYPSTLDAIVAPRSTRWRWGFAVLVPIAASVLLVVRGSPRDYVGTKGSALELMPFFAAEDGPHQVSNGDTVPANASLRFRVRAGSPCTLWLVSVDSGGSVSRLSSVEGLPIRGITTTPGGVRLDGKPGLERFYAVCARPDVGYARIEQAAREVAAGGETAVRGGGSLPGLPTDAAQVSVWIEKKP